MIQFPDGPARYRVCGRECTNGTPCQNVVSTPGDACWLPSHRDEDPRVDGGATSTDEVPLSGASAGTLNVVAVIAKAVAALALGWLGLGGFVADLTIRAAGILTLGFLALALDAYRRRALSEGNTTE